jgi:hypothetical protein
MANTPKSVRKTAKAVVKDTKNELKNPNEYGRMMSTGEKLPRGVAKTVGKAQRMYAETAVKGSDKKGYVGKQISKTVDKADKKRGK